MTVTLSRPTLEQCQQVRVWRDNPSVARNLRTGPKTETEQTQFYHEVVCAPYREHVYHALLEGSTCIGLGGLTYLRRWPGREPELSLLIGPPFQRRGLGRLAVQALLAEAFEINMQAVIGESYLDGESWRFWAKLAAEGGWQTLKFGRSFFFRIERPDR